MRRSAVSLLPLLLAGCVRIPSIYEPASDRKPMEIPNRHTLAASVRMNSPEAALYCLRDISPSLEAGTWRWTAQRPALRFVIGEATGQRLFFDLTVPKISLDLTGPVQIAFSVNRHLLDTVTYDNPGPKRFEKPVPPEWLSAWAENEVSAEIDKTIPAAGGARQGFILSAAGFVQ